MQENQRVRITKQMLKDSLLKLLENESIHKLSVKEICAEAQINRSTFYKYYGSPYDLFEELENEMLIQINNCFDDSNPDADAQTTKALAFIEGEIDLIRLLLNNSTDREFPEKLIALQYFKHLIAKFLNQKYSDDVLSYIYDFVIHGGFSIIRKWINVIVKRKMVHPNRSKMVHFVVHK